MDVGAHYQRLRRLNTDLGTFVSSGEPRDNLSGIVSLVCRGVQEKDREACCGDGRVWQCDWESC